MDRVSSRTDGWNDLSTSDKIDRIVAEHDAHIRRITGGLYQLLRFSGAEMQQFRRHLEEKLIEPRTP